MYMAITIPLQRNLVVLEAGQASPLKSHTSMHLLYDSKPEDNYQKGAATETSASDVQKYRGYAASAFFHRDYTKFLGGPQILGGVGRLEIFFG